MKKTILGTALAASLVCAGAVNAAPQTFIGTLDMVNPFGFSFGTDPNVTGTIDLDAGTGTLNGFFGGPAYSAVVTQVSTTVGPQSMTLVSGGANPAGTATYSFSLNPGEVALGLLFNYDGTPQTDIPVLLVWDAQTGPVNAVDSDGDDVAGHQMANGPFPGVNPNFSGTLTPVPVPAAAWLFGSAVLGMVGIGRRKKNVA